MSPEKQRIAIAEFCGWRFWRPGDPFLVGQKFADTKFNGFVRRVERICSNGVTLDVDESPLYETNRFDSEFISLNGWLSPNGTWKLMPPNYPNDLNAIHEAEKCAFIGPAEWDKYIYNIRIKIGRDIEEKSGPGSVAGLMIVECAVSATAAQRAEAFLRTLGKWEE